MEKTIEYYYFFHAVQKFIFLYLNFEVIHNFFGNSMLNKPHPRVERVA